ncbi:MAG: 4-hydroxythreonine-4-phosphate dehydrogenase PdxA [Deltaproteobacteria bacterium]|nr:4-hydroxythreonine-4-phosphate dehydrogenase PdxA [Deltaproteobacteria bacterium]
MNRENESIRPVIALTMGDAAGIGPEIILKALIRPEVTAGCRPVVFGRRGALVKAERILKTGLVFSSIYDAAEIPPGGSGVGLVDLGAAPESDFLSGKPAEATGKDSAEFIMAAVKAALAGRVEAVVTCPINKQTLNQAGYHYQGHTQFLARLTGTDNVVMMLAAESFKVTLVTIHVPLRDVSGLLTIKDVLETMVITWEALRRDFAFRSPRLAVAGLNPHAGEEGLFGREDIDIIGQAVSLARERGMNISGPWPADTIFYRAARGEFDAVVAMYHDQGLIPFKLLHFADGVNVTLNMPIIRTSVDHGTAYDLAGTGRADESSLVAAIRMAVTMAENRKRRPLNHLDAVGKE